MHTQEHTSCMDMSVLERQAARFKWLLQQQHKDAFITPPSGLFFDHKSGNSPPYDNQHHHLLLPSGFEFLAPGQIVSHPSLGAEHCQSTTSTSHVPAAAGSVAAVVMAEDGGGNSVDDDGSHKRKTETEECREKKKRVKGETEVEEYSSRTRTRTDKNCREMMPSDSRKNDSGAEKSEYIHVRARRGQATDSHSLAERARREKISRKMKYLQDLVPGCNKVTGRAGMLDEIINYVQSLQRQVEFLSMKLAAVNPGMEFDSDKLQGKEFPTYATFPTAISSMFPIPGASLAQLHQLAASREFEILNRNHSHISSSPEEEEEEETPTSTTFVPELCIESSSFPQVQVQPFWEADSHTFQDMGFHHQG